MIAFLAEVRHAIRSLLRSSGFAAAALLTLAIGIGANTALFSVLKAALLRPLPYGEPERSVVVWSSWSDFPQTWVSYDEYEAWREQIGSFEALGLFTDFSASLTGGTEPERIHVAQVNANVFDILKVQPILGRTFTLDEDRAGGPPVMIISEDIWQRRFAGDPSIIGRIVHVDGEPQTVVGVMPGDFRLPLDYGPDGPTQAWFPLAADPAQAAVIPGPALPFGGGNHGYFAVARLQQGVSAATANRELREWSRRNTAENLYPQTWNYLASAVPVAEQVVGKIRGMLYVLFGAVSLVLLIACANVAGLFLVRGEHRRRELAVRTALGAGRAGLMRLLLTESLVLAIVGGALGAWLASLVVMLLPRFAPSSLPRIAEASVDAGVLAFTLLVSLAALALFGLVPALRSSSVLPAEVLKESSRGATGTGARVRLRKLLVAGQAAVAVILVVAAGLMVRTVSGLLSIDPGFNAEQVLTMRVAAPSAMYPDSASVAAFYDHLRHEVAQLPGVRAVGAARILPLATEMGDWGMAIEGYTPPAGEGTPGDWQVVTPGYFEAMRLKLLSGRFFDERDHIQAPLAMIINKRMADKYFAGRDPLGARIRIGNPEAPQYTVVGVVQDVRHNALTAEVKPQFYAPQAQFAVAPGFAPRTMSLVIRAERDPEALIAPVLHTVRRVDSRLPVFEVRTMKQIVHESIAQPRFTMLLLGAFSVLALLLALIGIYGVVAQVVAMRTRELGIRMALGATPRSIITLSLGSGLQPAATGVVAGIALSLILTRVMEGLVYGVATIDALTFASAAVGTAGMAAIASLMPARRAARVDPAGVLRQE